MTGVLFDLDGVLIDSESIYSEFWSNIDKLYPTGIDEFAYRIKGSNLQRILNFFPDKEIQKDILKRIDVREKSMIYPIFPGVMDFLNELTAANIPCAIVTSSDITKMNNLFKQHPDFRSHFQGMITGDMVSKSKPDPECFHKGAQSIGVPINDCIIFEDSPSGIEAALATGTKVIALATTLKIEDINKKVDKIINSFVDFHVNDMLSVFSKP